MGALINKKSQKMRVKEVAKELGISQVVADRIIKAYLADAYDSILSLEDGQSVTVGGLMIFKKLVDEQGMNRIRGGVTASLRELVYKSSGRNALRVANEDMDLNLKVVDNEILTEE